MLILLLIIIFVVWLLSYSGPRYYPAYTGRYSRYPLWGGRSHILTNAKGAKKNTVRDLCFLRLFLCAFCVP